MDYSDIFSYYGAAYNWFWIVIVIGLLANIGLSFIPASMARKKGYSFGGFYALSFFVSFLIAIIVVACLSDKSAPPAYAGQPYYPPQGFQAPPQQYQQPQYQPPAEETKFCSKCGGRMNINDLFCGKCGNKSEG